MEQKNNEIIPILVCGRDEVPAAKGLPELYDWELIEGGEEDGRGQNHN